MFLVLAVNSIDLDKDRFHPAIGLLFKTTDKTFHAVSSCEILKFKIQIPNLSNHTDFKPILPVIKKTLTNEGEKIKSDIEMKNAVIDHVNHLFITHNMLLQDLFELRDNIMLLTSNENSQNKRAIFSAGGSVLKWLFGVGTESDIKTLVDKTHFIENDMKILDARAIESEKLGIKLANITNERFSQIWHTINNQSSAMKIMSTSMSNMTSYLEVLNKDYEQIAFGYLQSTFYNRIHVMASITELKIITLNRMIELFEDWELALIKLKQGFLSPKMVSPKAFQVAFDHLAQTLLDKNSNLRAIRHQSINDIYEIPTTTAKVINDTVYIGAAVPMTTTGAYRIYHVTSMPFPVHGHEENLYNKIQDMKPYFAVSHDGSHFVELSRAQYSECAMNKMNLCPHLGIHHNQRQKSCLATIFLGLDELIMKHCDFLIYKKPLPQFVQSIGNGMVLISNHKNPLTLICEDYTKIIQISEYSTVVIPCNCKLESDTFTTDINFHNCQSVTNTVHIRFPINFPMATLYNFSHLFETPVTMFQTKTPPIIQLPNIEALVARVNINRNKDGRLGTSMKDLALAMAGTKYLPIDNIPDPSLSQYMTWGFSEIMTVSLLALASLINFLAFALLFYKHKCLAALIQIIHTGNAFVINEAQGVATVEGSTIKPVPFILTPSHMFYLDYGLRIGVGLVLAAIFVIRIVQTWQTIKFCFRACYRYAPICCSPPQLHNFAKIYIKISSPTDSETMYLTKIPFEFNHAILANHPQIVELIPVCNLGHCYVNITWTKNLTVLRNDEVTTVILPVKKSVTPIQYGKLKNVLRRRASLTIMLMYRLNSDQAYAPIEQLMNANKNCPPAGLRKPKQTEDAYIPSVTEIDTHSHPLAEAPTMDKLSSYVSAIPPDYEHVTMASVHY